MAENRGQSWKKTEEKPAYLWEMLSSQTNLYTALGAAALGAGLSIPVGFGVAMIPLVCYVAGAAIAGLFVPNSASFRNKVDLKYRRTRRESIRRHLLSELDSRPAADASEFAVYKRILERIDSLRAIAANRDSSMSESDVESLEDSSVDYLGLLLAKALLEERRAAMDAESLSFRRTTIHSQLEASKSAIERNALQKALADLESVMERYRQIENRGLAIDAAMLSMQDTVEEIYHHMITNPNTLSAANYLEGAVERLRLEQELDYTLDSEFDEIPALGQVAAVKTASEN